MAPNRASSPTGMLWAHQLKREHGFLLDRMKKLETAIGKVESTAKSAKNASATHDIGSIAQQVKALTQDGSSKATEKIRKEVMERLENVDADLEVITLKVAKLDENSAKVEEERKRAFNNEKALVKRVKDVEQNLSEYEKNLSRLGEQINQRQLDVIREQLANLLDQVKEDGAQRESFKMSLKVLEQITSALKGDNEKLAWEIKELGKRPALLSASISPPVARRQPGAKVDTGALPMTEVDDEESPMPEPPRFTTKTIKSTRTNKRGKGRGMACSECRKARIRCEHDVAVDDAVEEEESMPEISAPKQTAASSSNAAAPQAPTKIAAPQAAPGQSNNARNTRTIKKQMVGAEESNPQVKAPAKRGLQRELQQLKAASQFIKKEPTTQRTSQRQVVDSGRGWVTFEHTPSDEEDAVPAQSSQDSSKGLTAAERVKRGHGRQRKIAPDTPRKPVVAKRARGRPRKDSSQAQTQAGISKRPRGRPRKDSSQNQAQNQAAIDTPKRGPGRPRKDINQLPTATTNPTPAPAPAPRRRQIKPEPSGLRAQPLREAKAVPTTEPSSPVQPPTKKATVIKQDPGREKKQSAPEALKKWRSDPYAVPTSSPLSSPQASTPVVTKDEGKAQGKRKAVEGPAPRQVKRRTIGMSGD